MRIARGKGCAALAIASMLLASGALRAQEALFVSMKSDGTGSVVIDRSRAVKTAWITDGGRSGDQGIEGALIEGRPVLEYLASQKIKTIWITCSHPHADHIGGLVSLIKDKKILDFNVIFVDNEYPSEKEPLFKVYQDTHGNTKRARYESAKDANAFAGDLASRKSVTVSNFKYPPDPNDKDEHGHSVITQYDIGSKKLNVRVIDFDDAATSLVDRWANSDNPRANVVIYPHHGSSNNSIASLLAKGDQVGLSSVIFTVNRKNRYNHPSPAVLLDMLQKLSADNVFITDSEIGRNVRITSKGISDGTPAEHRKYLAEFVTARIERYMVKTREVVDQVDVAPTYETTALTALPSRLRVLVEQKRLSTEKAKSIAGYLSNIAILTKALTVIDENKNHPTDIWFLPIIDERGFDGPGSFTPPRDPNPNTDAPKGGTGAYFDKLAASLQELRSISAPKNLFDLEMRRPLPKYGGIVIGNDVAVAGPPVSSLDFIETEDEGGELGVYIRINLTTDNYADYLDVTRDELWAAYNFVQPTPQLASRFPERIVPDAAGAVALNCDTGLRECSPSLHPALATSSLAFDFLRADSVIGLKGSHSSQPVPAYMAGIQSVEVTWSALQWYDVPAEILIDSHRIQVAPAHCILSAKFIDYDYEGSDRRRHSILLDILRSEYSRSRNRPSTPFDPSALDLSAPKRNYSFGGPNLFTLPKRDLGSGLDLNYASNPLEKSMTERFERRVVGKTYDSNIAGMYDDATTRRLVGAYTAELSWTQTRIDGEAQRAQRIERANNAKPSRNPPSPEAIDNLCVNYPPLVRVDRFARLVAVLRWVRMKSGRELPSLPTSVVARQTNIPAKWQVRYAQTADHSSSSSADISAVAAANLQLADSGRGPEGSFLPLFVIAIVSALFLYFLRNNKS